MEAASAAGLAVSSRLAQLASPPPAMRRCGNDHPPARVHRPLREIRERLRRYTVIGALVMLGAGLIAFLVASRLHHVISGPIHELVRAAKAVSTGHDYSLRVPNQRGDEVGVLIAGFNEMLDQIESRAHAWVHAQDELELRVDERTAELRAEIREREQTQAELERARDAAESATRAKSAFLANMSHEIRTPMNVIIGMTDMALDGELAPETRDYLQTVRRATLGLRGIINDILDCSKTTSSIAPRSRRGRSCSSRRTSTCACSWPRWRSCSRRRSGRRASRS